MKRNELMHTMQSIYMPKDMQERISHRMTQDNEHKEVFSMLNYKKRMAAVVIAAAVVCGSAFAFGSTAISSMLASSSSTPDYTALPTVEQCEHDAGYAPVLVERFDNGYVFDNGNLVKGSLQNEDNETVEAYKGFTFRYNNGSENITLSQDKYTAETPESGICTAQKDGISYYETDQTYKFVPADYQMTEQDKQDEASGTVVFSFGSNDDIETQRIHSITWTVDDMHYCLQQADGSLTSAQMLEMAQQITAAR